MSIARPWHRRLTDEGSTLVEALIATLVLTTGLLAMADLVRLATSSNVRARSGTIAGILAGQKLEQLLSLDFDDISGPRESPWSLQRNTPDFVDHVDGGGAIVGGRTFKHQRPRSTRVDGPSNGCRRVSGRPCSSRYL